MNKAEVKAELKNFLNLSLNLLFPLNLNLILI